MSAAPPAGTMEAAAARLTLWATSPGDGFIKATFSDPRARDSVLRSVRSQLPAGIPLHIITVPPGDAEHSARYIIAELQRLGPGLVSIHDIGAGLPPTEESANRVLHTFNAFRERFRVPGQHSIWWLPEHVARAFSFGQRDLASWFLKQFEITEILPPERPHTGRAFGTRRIYLSAVSAEYKILRGSLDAILRRAGFDCEFQEIFPQAAADTLRKISDLLRPCRLVIHIAGHLPGSVAEPGAVRDLFHVSAENPRAIAEKDFLAAYPALRAALGDFSGITYTQWESLLALHHGIPLLVYVPADALIKGTPGATFAQRQHLERLLLASRHPEPCAGDPAFLSTIPADIYRHFGIPDPAEKPHNLPYPTLGTLFKGRAEFLTTLRDTLAKQNPAVIRGAQAIHGMGGVGKTRAAVEYAWAHQQDYNALLFITADSPDALTRNLAALCGPFVLNLPEQATTDSNIHYHAVLHWLQQHPGWFLIIDNADTPDARTAVSKLLASLPGGHVVITSRLADWPAGVTPLDLAVLSEDSSVAFLLERTHDRRVRKNDDPATALTIARALDCLALALEQSAAYIRHHRCSLAEYLRQWETRRHEILRWHDSATHQYQRSVAVTYATSVAQLTPDATELLRILSWLAPDPMPVAHLENVKDLPDPRRHLMELCDLHLATLSADGTTFSIHRLLQEITRQQQESGAELNSVNAPDRGSEVHATSTAAPPALLTALQWVNDAMPRDTGDVRTWPVAVPLLPHAVFTATAAAARDLPTPTARLLNECALLLKTQANYPAAEPHYRRALALTEKHLDENHPETAICLNNLATLLQATNRLAEAEPLMRRALAIDEASFGKDHPNVARCLNNLAQLLQATNRLAEAEPLMRRALAIDEASFGNDHPNVAIRLNNLARLLQDTNRLAEAEPLMRRALAIDEASFGKDHPEVATDLNNLAALLQDTNRLAEAEPLMRRALAMDEASFGNDHPKVANRLNNLAQLLKATNRLAEAEPLMCRALAIDEASFGNDHPKVALRLNNLARLLQDTNRLAEAEPMMARAWRIFEDSLGSAHPSTVTVGENLSILRKEMGI